MDPNILPCAWELTVSPLTSSGFLSSLYLNSVPPHSSSPENSKCLLLYYLIPPISQATTSSLKHFLYLASRILCSPHFLPSRLHSFSISFTGSFSSSSLLNIGVSQDSNFRPLFCLYLLLDDVIQFNGFKYPLSTNNSRIYVDCPDLQNRAQLPAQHLQSEA